MGAWLFAQKVGSGNEQVTELAYNIPYEEDKLY